MNNQEIISSRFRGPPTTGNGGYSCGVVAKHIGDSAKVRLHASPPLDQTMEIKVTEESVELYFEDQLIASGVSSELEMQVPQLPSFEQAQQAQKRFIGYEDHIFPGCFVCGPERDHGDGLRIFPGPVTERDWSMLACLWQPSDDLYGNDGLLKPEFIWAALDCPTYFGSGGANLSKALLGEQELRIVSSVKSKSPLIVSCWPISDEGRKIVGGAAISSQEGELIAFAKGTWIRLKGSSSDA